MKSKIFLLIILFTSLSFADQDGSCEKNSKYNSPQFRCWYGVFAKNNILKVTDTEIQMGLQGDRVLGYVGEYDPSFINVFFLGQNDWAVGGTGVDIFEGYEGKDELWGRGGMDKYYNSGTLRLPDYEAGERINEIIDVAARDKN
jgi:hypothetical protein